MRDVLDRIYRGDAAAVLQDLREKAGGPFLHLTVTSPPYNIGQPYAGYADDLPYHDYLTMLTSTLRELRKATVTGGRLALNIPAGVNVPGGRAKKGYWAIQHDTHRSAVRAGWKPYGEVLWYKQQIFKRTAWGSWKQPSSPCFVYSWEHVQVFYNRSRRLEPNGHPADITADEFKHWSDGFWHINPEGRKLGHPCPFPEKLVYRLVKFLCYPGMVVCDPWVGTGTTPAVAKSLGRRWVGIDISRKYVGDARRRVAAVAGT